MQASPPVSRFRELSPNQARWVLALTLVVGIASVAISLSPLRSGNADRTRRGAGDVALYNAIVTRVHAGEGYYSAAADELPLRGYPTRSVFNWRTPLPMWLLGRLPDPLLGQALLALLAVSVLMWGFGTLADEGGLREAVIGGLLLTGVLLLCIVGNLYVMPVLWGGVFIALSACGYARGNVRVGVAAGLLAVLFRELALPYAVLCAAIALWNRRWRELAAWGVGLAVLISLFVVHVTIVQQLMTPDAVAHEKSWVRFGGWPFLLSTAQMNGYLLLLPQWVTAIYLPLAVLGFAAWRSPAGNRVTLTICGYLVAFAVVGQPFNQYWGSLIAPLLCFGVALAPRALSDLWQASQLTQRGSKVARQPG